ARAVMRGARALPPVGLACEFTDGRGRGITAQEIGYLIWQRLDGILTDQAMPHCAPCARLAWNEREAKHDDKSSTIPHILPRLMRAVIRPSNPKSAINFVTGSGEPWRVSSRNSQPQVSARALMKAPNIHIDIQFAG